ncbi:TENP protein, partial [Ramphastos sulfuratus]|nr:TENP protein [Ramphastos sulfuratus]
LSLLLSLLVPAQPNRSPDCGGILTPSGLSYFAEVSKPHTEAVLRQQLVADSDLFASSSKPSRKQVSSVNVSRLALALVPHAGLRLSIDADLGISSAPPASKVVKKLSILADLHVEMNLEGNMELVTSSCKPTLEGTGSSTEEVERWSLSFAICLEVAKLLLSPNERLFSLTTQFPVTPSCQVQYVPLAVPMFSEQGIIISLQTTFQVAGIPIPLPVSPVPFSMPEPGSSSPSHLILAFSEHFYTSLFFALEIAGAFNMTLLSPLTTNTMAQKIPQMGSLFQEDVPVILQAVFRSSPRVELEEGRAALKLFLTIHVGASPAAFQSFLSVSVVSVPWRCGHMPGVPQELAKCALGARRALGTCPVRDAVLEEMFLPTIGREVPAQLNEVLSEGIFLPHISGFTYTDLSVAIHRDYVLVPCNLRLQERLG